VEYEVPEKYRNGKSIFPTINASTNLKDLVGSESWKILSGRILERECRATAYRVKQRGV